VFIIKLNFRIDWWV